MGPSCQILATNACHRAYGAHLPVIVPSNCQHRVSPCTQSARPSCRKPSAPRYHPLPLGVCSCIPSSKSWAKARRHGGEFFTKMGHIRRTIGRSRSKGLCEAAYHDNDKDNPSFSLRWNRPFRWWPGFGGRGPIIGQSIQQARTFCAVGVHQSGQRPTLSCITWSSG